MPSNKALTHLGQDSVMRKLIHKYSLRTIKQSKNLFADIVESIIGQQLSSRPANLINQRFINLFSNDDYPSPQQVVNMPDEKIRTCGMSWSKTSYIRNVARAFCNGSLDIKTLNQSSDEKVISKLTKIKGIGRWTAEMILIFSLGRPDIFSLGDLGLRTAVSRLYRADRSDLKEIEKISLGWKPYRSLASRYLWKSLENR